MAFSVEGLGFISLGFANCSTLGLRDFPEFTKPATLAPYFARCSPNLATCENVLQRTKVHYRKLKHTTCCFKRETCHTEKLKIMGAQGVGGK